MRYFGADVLTILKTIATNSLNTTIALIQTERTDTGLELISKINVGKVERQYPECVINLQDSTLISEELNLDITDTPETYPAEVLILLRDNTDNISLRQEYYLEALQRIYHGYTDANVSWITVENCIRTAAYTEQKETLRVIGVSLSIRIL